MPQIFAALRHGVRPRRLGRGAAALFVLIAVVAWPDIAAAQDFGEPDTSTDPRVTIDRVVIGLLLIATLLSMLTVLFVWHTNPRRRAEAAARKQEHQG